MENTQNNIAIENVAAAEPVAQVNTATAQAAEQVAAQPAKRVYHRLTVEEKAARDAEYEAYKKGVAERKAARLEKKAAAQQKFEERRTVDLDIKALGTAFNALADIDTADVKSVRAKINEITASLREIDKTLFHRSVNTVVTILK